METRLDRRFWLQGGAAALALGGLSACQKAESLQQVNIVGTSGTTNLVLAALMDQQGYLKEFGVTPNYINVADGNKVVAALLTGAADICPSAGFTQVLAAIARGAALKVVGGGALKNFNALFSGNPDVKTLKDLEGRSVGVGALGTQLHQTMIALCRKYGVDASKVTFANVGASTEVFKAVKAGVVDAGLAEVWLERGSGLHFVENGKTFESLPEYVNQTAFASTAAMTGKRDLIVKTLAAYAKLYRFIMSGDSEAAFVAASTRGLGRADPDGARAQWAFYRQTQPFAANLELPEDRVMFMQELNVATETQKTTVPYAQAVDLSLAQEAVKLLG